MAVNFNRCYNPAVSSSSIPTYTSRIDLTINGRGESVEVSHHWTLLRVLREVLNLTGAKVGCDRGECGSCTVLLDGLPVYACQMLAMQVGDREVVTVEGLAQGDELHPIQQAFIDEDAGQCGFCTPGFIMSTLALLKRNPEPSEAEVRRELVGNLCRCNAYGRILAGVIAAAKTMRGEA